MKFEISVKAFKEVVSGAYADYRGGGLGLFAKPCGDAETVEIAFIFIVCGMERKYKISHLASIADEVEKDGNYIIIAPESFMDVKDGVNTVISIISEKGRKFDLIEA